MKPVLINWKGIVKYYRQVKKPTDRQVLLKAFFVAREEMSLLKLKFLNATLKDLVDAIDFFERRTELLRVSRNKLEDLLRAQILKFHDDPVSRTSTRKATRQLRRGDSSCWKWTLRIKRLY